MYESIWGLRNRPFSPTPEAARYFPADAIEESRQTLVRGIERAEGPGLLIGPAGCGKTLLCHLLALQFQSQFAIGLLSSTRIRATRDLLRAILFELGLPYRRMDEGDLRLALIGFLSRSEECPHGMLLIIDEAHSLNMRVLEELRMLSNLVRAGEPRVRLVLSGGPALEERFTHPKLHSFNQRLAARCYLRAWDRSETREFIHNQLATAGGDCTQIFSPEAIDQVHNATEGIPRLVVQLCDHTMTIAAAGGQSRIDEAGIQEAWADLQQLPAPWNESSARGQSDGEAGNDTIEFGQLDDEGATEELQPAPPTSESAMDESIAEPISELEMDGSLDETFERVTATFGALDELCQPTPETGPKLAAETRDAMTVDDDFTDEEVIVDHYATLDAEIGRTVVTPLDAEARELSDYFAGEAAIRETTTVGSPQDPLPEVTSSSSPEIDPYAENEMIDHAMEPPRNPSADPVMPELQSLATITLLREEAPALEETNLSVSSDELPLIVIEDGNTIVSGAGCEGPIAQREDYGQLFSRLQDA